MVWPEANRIDLLKFIWKKWPFECGEYQISYEYEPTRSKLSIFDVHSSIPSLSFVFDLDF